MSTSTSIFIGFIILLLFLSLFVVKQQTAAIIERFGKFQSIRQSGLQIKIPIIGMGGISGFTDIIEFLRMGASMVQVGTLNYRDPSIICKFYDHLKDFMITNNISDISNLTGKYKW